MPGFLWLQKCAWHAMSHSHSFCTVWILNGWWCREQCKIWCTVLIFVPVARAYWRAKWHGLCNMAFRMLLTFSGTGLESGCPLGSQSLRDPSSHHVGQLWWLWGTSLWRYCWKWHCIAVIVFVLINNSKAIIHSWTDKFTLSSEISGHCTGVLAVLSETVIFPQWIFSFGSADGQSVWNLSCQHP